MAHADAFVFAWNLKEGYHLTTGVPVAIKIINKEKLAKKADMDSKIRREIYNLRRFRHPHIIKLYEVIETQSDIFLVMELVGGGELFDYIIQRGKLAEVEARLLFQQMISAVGYCHHHKVAHRDLKVRSIKIFDHYFGTHFPPLKATKSLLLCSHRNCPYFRISFCGGNLAKSQFLYFCANLHLIQFIYLQLPESPFGRSMRKFQFFYLDAFYSYLIRINLQLKLYSSTSNSPRTYFLVLLRAP